VLLSTTNAVEVERQLLPRRPSFGRRGPGGRPRTRQTVQHRQRHCAQLPEPGHAFRVEGGPRDSDTSFSNVRGAVCNSQGAVAGPPRAESAYTPPSSNASAYGGPGRRPWRPRWAWPGSRKTRVAQGSHADGRVGGLLDRGSAWSPCEADATPPHDPSGRGPCARFASVEQRKACLGSDEQLSVSSVPFATLRAGK